MRKPKEKRSLRWQTQMLPFAVVWAIAITSATWIIGILIQILLYPFLTLQGAGVASNFLPTLVVGLIQVLLVERLLKRSMRRWMLYTTVGGFITVFLIHIVARSILYNPNFTPDLYMLVNFIAYYAPAPLLQFFWLRRRVNRAWFWPVISLFVMFLFSIKGFLTREYGSGVIEAVVQMVAYGILQASLMHTLWQHPKDAEKTKVDLPPINNRMRRGSNA